MTSGDLYLNHAGTSWPKPEVVTKAVCDAMSAAPSSWPGRFELAHRAIAEFFGVKRCEQLLLTPGCTSALAVAIGDALIPKGKRVLTSQWEHHALHRPLLKLASTGVRVQRIPAMGTSGTRGQEDLLNLDWLEHSLAVGNVGLIAITAACNVTGRALPYETVIRMAHDYGAMVLIDAAQIVGWLELDFAKLGADMVAFGGHKGLQGPWGIGGLYVADDVDMECVSASCELPTANSGEPPKPRRPGYCDVGSVDQYALAGLHAGVRLLQQQNMAANLDRARQQIKRIGEALEPLDDVRVLPGAGEGMPTLVFEIPTISSGQVAAHLARHGIVVGSGFQCAPLAHETLGSQETGLVRLSVGVGQPDEDIDSAIDRMRTALDASLLRSLLQGLES